MQECLNTYLFGRQTYNEYSYNIYIYISIISFCRIESFNHFRIYKLVVQSKFVIFNLIC